MGVVATKPRKTVVKIQVPAACTAPGELQGAIDDAFALAARDADRSAIPSDPDTETANTGLTRREMLAGMALPGILSRGVEPVRAAAIAVKAADAVLLLSNTHFSGTSAVTPAELIAAVYSPDPDARRGGQRG